MNKTDENGNDIFRNFKFIKQYDWRAHSDPNDSTESDEESKGLVLINPNIEGFKTIY